MYKKLWFVTLIIFGISIMSFVSANTLWEYYKGDMPSIKERAALYNKKVHKDEVYMGTAEQNKALLSVLSGDISFGVSVFKPIQGGTGIGSVTAGDVDKCLVVSDDSPFTWTVGTCGTGGGNFAWTPETLGNATSTLLLLKAGLIANSASSTITNLTMINSTSTNATTTNSVVSGGLLVGTGTRQGKAHVINGTALTYTINANGDDLVVESDSNTGISIISSATNAGSIIWGHVGDPFAVSFQWEPANDLMRFTTANLGADMTFETGNQIEAVRILDSGEFGIATTVPAMKLSVQGDSLVSGTSTAGALFATSTLRVGLLANCDTVDTDASGHFLCGDDETGAGGSGADPFPAAATSTLLTFTGGIIVNNATSTITNLTMVNATSTNATTSVFSVSTLASTTLLNVSSPTGTSTIVNALAVGTTTKNAILQVGGVVGQNYAYISSSFTPSIFTYHYIVDTSSGNITVSLPPALNFQGIKWCITKDTADANTIIIDPNGSEEISNQTTRTIRNQNTSWCFISTGSEWKI